MEVPETAATVPVAPGAVGVVAGVEVAELPEPVPAAAEEQAAARRSGATTQSKAIAAGRGNPGRARGPARAMGRLGRVGLCHGYSFGKRVESHSFLRASMGARRAALLAGYTPNPTPMAMATMTAPTVAAGEIAMWSEMKWGKTAAPTSPAPRRAPLRSAPAPTPRRGIAGG